MFAERLDIVNSSPTHEALTAPQFLDLQLKHEIKASKVAGWSLRGLGAGLMVFALYELTQKHYAMAAVSGIAGYFIFKKGTDLIKK